MIASLVVTDAPFRIFTTSLPYIDSESITSLSTKSRRALTIISVVFPSEGRITFGELAADWIDVEDNAADIRLQSNVFLIVFLFESELFFMGTQHPII